MPMYSYSSRKLKDGFRMYGNSIMTTVDYIYINGKKFKKPGKGNTVVHWNNRIFVNGFEFKKNRFKRTLRAFYECYIAF